MPFVNTQMAGNHFAFPDVCLTPSPVGPVPIPYPNTAIPNTAIPNQFKTLVLAMPAHNLMTTVPMSNGDNAGVAMNPVSGMVMGPCRHIMGSAKTMIGGAPVTKMLSPTGQNGMSPGAFGMSLVPSQTKMMVLS
ncbi:DUF4150 domain-containing protein [candidate division CSSED10-310 bacterium]|uniref:DUF4150 domain-containing protein n=1 Tax=candidate division CSSED10-310 bacterium TaxID=2855610 RepID=A0ABV6Z1T4_UNCC1